MRSRLCCLVLPSTLLSLCSLLRCVAFCQLLLVFQWSSVCTLLLWLQQVSKVGKNLACYSLNLFQLFNLVWTVKNAIVIYVKYRLFFAVLCKLLQALFQGKTCVCIICDIMTFHCVTKLIKSIALRGDPWDTFFPQSKQKQYQLCQKTSISPSS